MIIIAGEEAGMPFYLLAEGVMGIYTSHFHTVSTNDLKMLPPILFSICFK
jgi:hypothetical protein